jgi:hypothetical protein
MFGRLFLYPRDVTRDNEESGKMWRGEPQPRGQKDSQSIKLSLGFVTGSSHWLLNKCSFFAAIEVMPPSPLLTKGEFQRPPNAHEAEGAREKEGRDEEVRIKEASGRDTLFDVPSTHSRALSRSLFLSHTHTHTHTRARTLTRSLTPPLEVVGNVGMISPPF